MEITQKRGSASTHHSDTMFQRGKIHEEPLYYEHKNYDGSLPLIGVNTYLPKEHAGEVATKIELIRSTEEENGQQFANVQTYQKARNRFALSGETQHDHGSDSADEPTPQVHDGHGLSYLQNTARDRKNAFAALMEAVNPLAGADQPSSV